MELKDILLLLGGAILGYLVQIAGDRWRNVSDEYELWVDLASSSIETKEDGLGNQLEYVWKGRVVEHPHVVDLYIWSAGKRDITSDQFDGSRPLTFQLGVPIMGELEGSKFAAMEETAREIDSAGTVKIGPSIIRKRMAGHYRFITDGNPTLTTSNPVANLAQVSTAESYTMTPLRRSLAPLGDRFLNSGIVSLIVTGIAVSAVLGIQRQMHLSDAEIPDIVVFCLWVGLGITVLLGAAGGVVKALTSTSPRRVRRALRVLRRSLSNRRESVRSVV